MNPRSAKNKGSRFENYLVSEFHKAGIKAQRTYGSGNGLDKNDIRLHEYNIEIEAKNQKAIHLIEWWEQLERQTIGNNIGILAVRNPRKPEFESTLAIIELGDFIKLLGNRPESSEGDAIQSGNILSREASYAFKNLQEAARKALKFIE